MSWTPELKAKAIELRQSGVSRQAIADQLGLKLNQVVNFLKNNCIVAPPEARQKNAQAALQAKDPGLKKLRSKAHSAEANAKRSAIQLVLQNAPERKAFASASSKQFWAGMTEAQKLELSIKREQARKSSAKGQKQLDHLRSGTGVDNFKSQAILREEGVGSFEERCQKFAATKQGVFIGPYVDSATKTWWRCKYGHTFDMRPNNAFSDQWCPSCAGVGPSKGQLEVAEFIQSLGEETIIGYRQWDKDRPKLELDIFVPGKKFAVEYDGLLFHSDYFGKVNGEHAAKASACRKAGIKLLAIFEDEWETKQELVKEMIRYRLGDFQGKKYGARELELRSVTRAEARSFFTANHLDGAGVVQNEVHGLWDGSELIMCLSIKVNGLKEREISRMATKIGCTVAGGASKLIAAARKGQALTTFSNNRLGTGSVYESNGAKLVTEGRPGYWYTDGKTRIGRRECMRNNDPATLALFPTEKEQARGGVFSVKHFGDNRPLYRIEDYGNRKWVFS